MLQWTDDTTDAVLRWQRAASQTERNRIYTDLHPHFVMISRGMAKRFKFHGCEWDDFIQRCVVRLHEALDGFDPAMAHRPVRFFIQVAWNEAKNLYSEQKQRRCRFVDVDDEMIAERLSVHDPDADPFPNDSLEGLRVNSDDQRKLIDVLIRACELIRDDPMYIYNSTRSPGSGKVCILRLARKLALERGFTLRRCDKAWWGVNYANGYHL